MPILPRDLAGGAARRPDEAVADAPLPEQLALDLDRPALGRSRVMISRRSVVLPDPHGPMMATFWPPGHVEVDAAQDWTVPNGLVHPERSPGSGRRGRLGLEELGGQINGVMRSRTGVRGRGRAAPTDS